MPSGSRPVLFILLVAAAFVYLGNAIPQIKSAPAGPVKVTGGTPEELAAAGKKIFMSDRAQCLTCHVLHNDPKARCPNQGTDNPEGGLGKRAQTRKAGMSAAEYIIESVYNPNAYVVPGYPKNQMQPVNKPPIALSHDEILAVTAFLNTLGGKTDAAFIEQVKKAQEPWRQGRLKPEAAEEKFRPPIFKGDAARGREVFRKRICIQCHRVGKEGRDVGPDLSAIGASQTPSYILESILDPNAVIVKGYKQTLVRGMGTKWRGTALAWRPSKAHPRSLKLGVNEYGQTKNVEVDLTEADYVGDTVVVVKEGRRKKVLYGEYVSGGKKSGVKLRFLEHGRWVERSIPPERIAALNLPLSPMPANVAETLRPREVYDLLAYLLAQKGKP